MEAARRLLFCLFGWQGFAGRYGNGFFGGSLARAEMQALFCYGFLAMSSGWAGEMGEWADDEK